MKIISASLLSADGARLGEEVRDIESAGADWIHIDVMDGHFVPDITLGPSIVRALRSWTSLPFDVHLMVDRSAIQSAVFEFIEAGATTLTFHPEAFSDPESLLRSIKQKGCNAGLAISPGYDYQQWPDIWWSLLDMVTLMAVVPGRGGQSFLPETPNVLKEIRAYRPTVLISVDGGINAETVKLVSEADVVVSGSFIFSGIYEERVACLRGLDPGVHGGLHCSKIS